ncbi:histidine phosphatase superfamily [Sporodiniella umbellata]|nr:histidine phosphatase superfamily [Sporodiniella umbellata]
MVGWPSEEKSYLASKVCRYLNWLGVKSELFPATTPVCEILSWYGARKGTVALFDAPQATATQRAQLQQALSAHHIQLFWVECSPDPERKLPYQTITENDLSFIRLAYPLYSHHYIVHQIQNRLQSRIVYYLVNLHPKPRRIWLSRHGESVFNVQDKIGGDSDLSSRGEQYASKLPFLVQQVIGNRPLTVWTSTLKRTIQTARHLDYPKKSWDALNELDTGVCDGLTYEEIASTYPDDFACRDQDKFNYRYPGGESYSDLVARLEPVIMDLERQEDVLIISHQATLRCLYAYFMGLSPQELPYAPIPLHTLIELRPNVSTCEKSLYAVDIGAVDTFRPKGQGTRILTNDQFVTRSSIVSTGNASPILPLSLNLQKAS